MADILGVAIEANVLRAAMNAKGQVAAAEVPWDPASPELAVDALRARFPGIQGIALSVGLTYLEIAQPELPPLAPADKRRVLLRDADRYFPLEGAVAVCGPGRTGLAFATSSERLHRWIRAFEAWVPVRAIVAAPDAIAAGVSVVHRAAPNGARLLIVDAGGDEQGLIRLSDGAVTEVRRLPVATGEKLPAEAELLNELYLPGSKGLFAAALGAIALAGTSLEEMLLDARLEREFRNKRTRRQSLSIAAVAISFVALLLAVNTRHDKALRVTRRASDSLWTESESARAAERRLTEIVREAQLVQRQDGATDPLVVVATLSRVLPKDAFVERMNWDGTEWRIDGSSNSAAAIVPSLDSLPRFTNVRALTASTRFRDGARMRESFSVAFNIRGDAVAPR